jgi:hypothetical protein
LVRIRDGLEKLTRNRDGLGKGSGGGVLDRSVGDGTTEHGGVGADSGAGRAGDADTRERARSTVRARPTSKANPALGRVGESGRRKGCSGLGCSGVGPGAGQRGVGLDLGLTGLCARKAQARAWALERKRKQA